jgi:hypothetical protein
MLQVAHLPLLFLQSANVLCINTDAAQQSVLTRAIREGNSAVAIIDAADTYAARERLHAVQDRSSGQAVRAPSVVLIGYEPEERWSLAVLLSELRDLGASSAIEVVLIADGPAYSLPVCLTDYPLLTVVPTDFHVVDEWVDVVRELMVTALDSAVPGKAFPNAE